MKRKIWILSIGAAIMLVLTFFPSSALELPEATDENLMMETPESEEMTGDSGTITMSLYHYKEDKTYEITEKELTLEERDALMDELKQVEESGLTLIEIFEKELEILKDYELVSSDMTLEDVLDVNKLTGNYNVVEDEGFEAEYAPIVFVGGGFGFGFGIPFFITSGTFLMILVGFGLVYCYDVLHNTLHQLMTLSFIPMLVGYLGGFIGLLLFGVVPGFFYSNLFGLGVVTKTQWLLMGGSNGSNMQ